jgi:hypothetical protein
MRRPDVKLFWNTLREWLEAESEVEFPSPAFGQVESFPDGALQVGLRDGNLQAHRFDCRPVPGGVLGFVSLFFCIHGVGFFCGSGSSCMPGWNNATKQDNFVYGVNTPWGHGNDLELRQFPPSFGSGWLGNHFWPLRVLPHVLSSQSLLTVHSV